MGKKRVALVHDWLTGQRGGEKVLEVLAEVFPEAPIFTLLHLKGSQIPAVEEKRIVTSFIQNMPFLSRKYRSYLPLFPLAIELLDLQEFDMVVSSSHCVAKGIIPRPDALHVCYIHSPVRYAWNQYHAYFSRDQLNFFSRRVIPPVIHRLRVWDESTSSRVDFFVANSRTTAQRVWRYYRRDADVIHPPVDTELFKPGSAQEDYFLIVSALVPYKRIDLAIEAFNRRGEKLKIVGSGTEYKRLKRMARSNTEFLGSVDSAGLLDIYQRARALIMPGEEDFGINALEAQACGVPVISIAKGGATETVVPGQTGLFFPESTPISLETAIDKIQSMSFNKETLRNHALEFSRESFKRKITVFLQEKWDEFVSRK
jgi:glycosyltransferase involved in cell wall biosynthesis